ncbi:uncharacterized protein G2W53_043944 [Senna tora]|uniref:Uncharacterized protein n=1 Tax=Senna tora TaxID=362788 RepID=A0A834SIK9_9FABA|nr:uncharacterized protein G2W53_043944 [Senna tora]
MEEERIIMGVALNVTSDQGIIVQKDLLGL